ncbi:MAG TPA: DUF1992 domain-containing protein [Micromonosporaceae bacterium]
MISGWEAAVEAQIRTAQQRGDFDNLPGAGKPLPGRDDPYDEMWWIKGLLERESLPTDLLLPTPLLLRKKIEQLPDEVRDLPTEQGVRALVHDLNAQIVDWLRTPIGPRVAVRPVDADVVVRRWRAERRAPEPALRPVPAEPAPRRPRRRWLRWPVSRGQSQQ